MSEVREDLLEHLGRPEEPDNRDQSEYPPETENRDSREAQDYQVQ